MVRVDVNGFVEMSEILKINNLSWQKLVDISIGNDDRIYFLFAENTPERKGGTVPTTNESTYQAIALTVDWYNGDVYSDDFIDFGFLSINFHYIQPIEDNFLLLGARSHLYKNGETDKNALIIDSSGNKLKSFCLGDGIADCIVDSENNIITSYFDEGVIGNKGWTNPLGSCGVVKWSMNGEKLWENKNNTIVDCYAMNIDDNNDLWFYTYPEFRLIKTNYKTEKIFDPIVKYSYGFLISQDKTAILMQKGLNEKGFCIMKTGNNKSLEPEDCEIVYGDKELNIKQFSFRSSKAVFLDENYEVYYVNWIC